MWCSGMTGRVVSSEIYSNLSGFFVNYPCQSAVSKSSIAKWRWSMFLTNNSSDLYALTSCIMLNKNSLFGSHDQRIWMQIIDVVSSRLLLRFPELLTFRKLSLQPQWLVMTVRPWALFGRVWFQSRSRCCLHHLTYAPQSTTSTLQAAGATTLDIANH